MSPPVIGDHVEETVTSSRLLSISLVGTPFVKLFDILFQLVLLQDKRPVNCIDSLTQTPGIKEGQGRWLLAAPLWGHLGRGLESGSPDL